MKPFFNNPFSRLFAVFDKPVIEKQNYISTSDGGEFLDDAIRITDQPFEGVTN